MEASIKRLDETYLLIYKSFRIQVVVCLKGELPL